MPSFCRHNRLIQNCTICSRELNLEARPVVSSSAPKSSLPRERTRDGEEGSPRRAAQSRERAAGGSGRVGGSGGRSARGGLKVRRLARGAEDGYSSPLLPGLRSSQDAERLAGEIAYSAWRLELMEAVAAGELASGEATVVDDAPAVWSEISAAGGDLEERTMQAFITVVTGPRGVGGDERLAEARSAYEAWAARAGSQAAAFTGELAWTPERRFERIFERLQFGGLSRDTRYELLTTLGRLGVYELRAGKLLPGGENETTWAAKRAFGIGDPLLLERRAAALAEACAVEIEALDLALHSWGAGARLGVGLPLEADGDESVLEQALFALEL